eukprot:5760374-Prymnesium_polylepis.1
MAARTFSPQPHTIGVPEKNHGFTTFKKHTQKRRLMYCTPAPPATPPACTLQNPADASSARSS